MRSENCRHCGKLFIPQPQKSGFIDECPQCVEERQTEAAATAESEETMDQLKESIRTSRFAPEHSSNPEK
jgi:phage FluMu protein Com